MGKIFFSYSWSQENTITNIANSIGRDFIIQDQYVFDAGNRLDDEMKSKIKASEMFVIFLSQESLKSENVQLELSFVASYVFSKKILFCPVLIDENLEISEDWDNLEWIKDYLLKYYTNNNQIERLVKQKIRQLYAQKYGYKNKFFKGRESDKAEIIKQYFSNIENTRRAVFVSGVPNIGRKSLLINTLLTSLDTSLGPTYEPITTSLAENDSIDSLIEQLMSYSDIKGIDNKLKNGEYEDTLIEILNDLYKDNQRIVLEDNNCIVLRNGKIVDWFENVIKNPKLVPFTHLFVASRNSIAHHILRKLPQIQNHRLNSLTKDDMRVIFTSYAKEKNVVCNSQDAEFYINKFNGYPQIILNVVDDISKSGHDMAKRWLENNASIYDKSNRLLLEEIEKDDKLYKLTLTLSRFEYISYDILCELLPSVDILDKLEKLYYMSLTETFGNQFYRLDRSLSEYINRRKIALAPEVEKKVEEMATKAIEDLDASYLDLSEKLFVLKENIKKNPGTVTLENLLPSYCLKVIIELYHKKDYPQVETLAIRLLNDSQKNIYDSITRTVTYWLCLAASRNESKDVFDKYVQYFDGKQGKKATFYFLKGFYERHKGTYKNARKWYEKAKECSQDGELQNHLTRVNHELALVYVKLDDDKALPLAKSNYECEKDNPYQIETYYRCLVRSEEPDVNILKELISAMENSHDEYKDVIVDTFNAEYIYYIENNVTNAVDVLKSAIEDYPNTIQYPIDALRYIVKLEKKKGNIVTGLEDYLKAHKTTKSIYRFD